MIYRKVEGGPTKVGLGIMWDGGSIGFVIRRRQHGRVFRVRYSRVTGLLYIYGRPFSFLRRTK